MGEVLVRPRVRSPLTDETLLLEDALEPFLQRGDPGAICILGDPGTGKSSALRSLAARIPKGSIVELLDEPPPARILELCDRMLVIYAAMDPIHLRHHGVFRLSPWGEDEVLEYVLGAHKDRCASLMRRLRPQSELPQTPELWTICIDRMAADESIDNSNAAILDHLRRSLPTLSRRRAGTISYRRLAQPEADGPDETSLWGHRGFLGFLLGRGLGREEVRLLRNPRVRMLLAAEHLARKIAKGSLHRLEPRLPAELIRKTGALLAGRFDALAKLERQLRDQIMSQPMGVSLLHVARPGWKPPEDSRITWFWGAYLAGAKWSGIRLTAPQFAKAQLTEADLSESSLDHAEFTDAQLIRTVLRGSSIHHCSAKGADLTGADLSHVRASRADFTNAVLRSARFESALLQRSRFLGCDLRGVRFCRADLMGALFGGSSEERVDQDPEALNVIEKMKEKGYTAISAFPAHPPASLEEADFTGANLEKAQFVGLDLRQAILPGARFFDANLTGANLEGVHLPGGHFEGALMYGALLTGSVMPGASFRGAKLQGARLADIEWEKTDLREADLRKVNFHMGSSRSGLLFGEPSEGTRTGFYTDEFFDQSYRAPEEIRAANLRGADLRGARVLGTDFYLVDLREALYTEDQEEWFRKCGAILETRV